MREFDNARDDFLYFLKVIGIFSAVCIIGLLLFSFASGMLASDHPGQPSVYHQVFPAHLSAELMPGQGFTVQNTEYSTFEIQSEYPVSVEGGNCYFPRGAEIKLYCDPTNLQITDLRPRFLAWAHSNHVSVTAR